MNAFINLALEFEKISGLGYIKGVNNSLNAVGLTFESLLNKKPDSMYFPDYSGIEIKCSQRYSKYPVSLFSLAFDGPHLYEINRVLELYGKTDFDFKDKKILIAELNAGRKIIVNNEYFFELQLDRDQQKLYLAVYDQYDNLLERESYIEFETIKQRLELKLSKLALVYASKKEINSNKYYRYYQLILYQLKSFETFLNLVEQGIISITLSCRVARSGEEVGRQRNKNLVFQIRKEYLNYLFNEEYNCNKDL